MHVHQFWRACSLWFERYGYLSKTAKFPFRGMDYSPWSWKNSIDRNQLKKFMQVGVDVTCMHTSFGGRDPSGFGDMATFQKRPNFLFGACPWSWKILKSIGIGSKILCKKELTSSACTPIVVGVVSPVSEIKLAYGP